MKYLKSCTKCQSVDIVRIPGELGNYGAGNTIRVGWTYFHVVKVTRYLCASCGFIEEWIDAAADVAKVKTKYAS
jgi:hypothetical protein